MSPADHRAGRPPDDDAAAGPPTTEPLGPILADRARAHPGRSAVEGAGVRLTYGELAEAVLDLAAVLRTSGPPPGRITAVLLPDGVRAVVAYLAALVAGRPFVWLDPDAPTARTQTVVRDCRPATTLRATPAGWTLDPPTEGAPSVPPDTGCLVYTSGSTGQPKGIVQRRGNLYQFAHWFADELELGAGSRSLLWASMTYDAAYVEILASLVGGATLVVADDRSDPARVAEQVHADGITHLLAVPSLLRAVLACRGAARFPAVSSLGLFGEVVDPALVADAERLLPAAAVRNFYGPTECILASWYRVPRGFQGDVVPIGRPIPGRQILLRDTAGDRAPGVGEICVRSDHLATGYLNRDEETARRFLPDETGGPSSRVYRTGDLGRLSPDGDLVFVGRVDDQVKIHGVRVQPEEAEAALRGLPGVADAVVVVRHEGAAPPRLVAYLRAGSEAPDVPALRRILARLLPPVMLPTQYVVVPDFPRTDSGKVDRRALGSRTPPEPVTGPGTRPLTETEAVVAGVWAEIVGRPDVGPDDDFFDIGGHSLLGPRVVAEISERIGVRIPLRLLFENPNLTDFASVLTGEDLGGRW